MIGAAVMVVLQHVYMLVLGSLLLLYHCCSGTGVRWWSCWKNIFWLAK